MARDPLHSLFASLRILQKRVLFREEQAQTLEEDNKPFQFNAGASVFVPARKAPTFVQKPAVIK